MSHKRGSLFLFAGIVWVCEGILCLEAYTVIYPRPFKNITFTKYIGVGIFVLFASRSLICTLHSQ